MFSSISTPRSVLGLNSSCPKFSGVSIVAVPKSDNKTLSYYDIDVTSETDASQAVDEVQLKTYDRNTHTARLNHSLGRYPEAAKTVEALAEKTPGNKFVAKFAFPNAAKTALIALLGKLQQEQKLTQEQYDSLLARANTLNTSMAHLRRAPQDPSTFYYKWRLF